MDGDVRTTLADFVPAEASKETGIRVAARDVDGDGKLDILTSSGELVSAFKGGTLLASGLPELLFAFDADPDFQGAVWIG